MTTAPVSNLIHAADRVNCILTDVKALRLEIETRWPHYHQRPTEAKELETTLTIVADYLGKSLKDECPDLDRLLRRAAAS